jgi:hypothetical protein
LSAKLLSASGGKVRVKLEDSVEIELPEPAQLPVAVGKDFKVAIRPERVAVRYGADVPSSNGAVHLKASLLENVYLGNANQIFIKPFGESGKSLMSMSMDVAHRQRREAGSAVWADVKASDILLLEPSPQ